MSGYSEGLREHVIKAWQEGKKQGWLTETFMISESTVKRYIARYKTLWHVQATEQERKQPTIRDEQLPQLVEQLQAHRGATLEKHVKLWNQRYGSPLRRLLPNSKPRIGRPTAHGAYCDFPPDHSMSFSAR